MHLYKTLLTLLSIASLVHQNVAAPMQSAAGSTSTRFMRPRRKTTRAYLGLTPESFGCVESDIKLKPTVSLATDREGHKGRTFVDPSDPTEQTRVKYFPSPTSRPNNRQLMEELDGLQKAKQFKKCRYTHENEDGTKAYYIFMRNIPGHSLIQALNEEAFADITDTDTEVSKHFAKLIREKAMKYAQADGIGHIDLKGSNIKLSGKTLNDATIDFIDWASWMPVPKGDEKTLAVYKLYLDEEVPVVLKGLAMSSGTVTPDKTGSKTNSPKNADQHLPSSSASGNHSPTTSAGAK